MIAFACTSLLALAATSAAAADAAHGLVGAWRYVGEIDTREDGSPAPPTALSATQGLLVYTRTGFVSVVLMPKQRRWSVDAASAEEMRETLGNGTAYAGRYEVDPVAGTVTHVAEVTMEPGHAGRRLLRRYRLDGDTLVLSGTFPWQGETIRFEITWERAD